MYTASIIIPYFRKKTFFKKTIRSITNQTQRNFEVIVIYDDEDLSELNYVRNIIQKDKRLKLHINKKIHINHHIIAENIKANYLNGKLYLVIPKQGPSHNQKINLNF